jgi:proteic killer suppression protein
VSERDLINSQKGTFSFGHLNRYCHHFFWLKIWKAESVKKMPLNIQSRGRRKLRMLNISQRIIDLRNPPSNKLEKLSGNLSDYYSIRINNQWRIIFQWKNVKRF